MIGMVIGELHQTQQAVEISENWAATIKKNTFVFEVQRLQPVSPGSLFFFFLFQTDDAIFPSIDHIISGKLARKHSAETLVKRSKYTSWTPINIMFC